MKKIKIAVIGYKGKMGSAVFNALKKEYEVIGIGKGDSFDDSVSTVVDFASAESSVKISKKCAQKNIPLVIGSTGQTEEQLDEIKEASTFVPILMAGNFSMGVSCLKNALDALIIKDAQDIVVFEKHHREKKDAPSGTAKEIAHFIEQNFNKAVGVIFERGGKELGTHVVDIYYENEVVSLSHTVFSREAFVQGVKKAVEFVLDCKNNGLYGMQDVKM